MSGADLPVAQLQAVADAFALPGRFSAATPYGTGHINDTYRLVCETDEAPALFLLQRLNNHVFADPVGLMSNVSRVTKHVRQRLVAEGAADVDRRVLTLVPTHDGADYHVDPEGNLWRCYLFITGARGYDIVEAPQQAYQAARAFGEFQRTLADFDAKTLNVTIPNFHNTPSRYATFVQAVDTDPLGRAASVREQIDWLLGQEEFAGTLMRQWNDGTLPTRVTHNDTKLNNVLIDDVTGEAVCVLDLDTIMPGVAAFDFADLVRSATNPVAEDEPNSALVQARIDVFEAIAQGFLEGTAGTLTEPERESLLLGGEIITLENAYRFLADYIVGDVYYKARHERHNADRAGTQIALVKSLRSHHDQLQEYVASLP